MHPETELDRQPADGPSRRHVISGIGLAAAAAAVGAAPAKAAAPAGGYWNKEYVAMKGDVKLQLYRRRKTEPSANAAPLPVLLMVHGSSISGMSSWDLNVPGAGEYSVMNVFAGFGYDCWVIDFEGYGKSSVTSGNSDIKSGVADLVAATPLIAKETGQQKFHMMGESSGALRVAAFAAAHPERVDRVCLGAYTYTGIGSPTLNERAKQVDFYRTHNRRPRDRDMIRSIFTRDKPGTSDPAVGEALADVELPFGDSVPTGTYLDMTANLPVVDPLKVHAPVMIVRGEFDGIATEEDLLNFYKKLPYQDRQFVVLPGAAHSVSLGTNRQQFWHVMRTFLEMPPRLDGGKAG